MTHKQMSKKGGSMKSEAKTKAARKNWEKARLSLMTKHASKKEGGGSLT